MIIRSATEETYMRVRVRVASGQPSEFRGEFHFIHRGRQIELPLELHRLGDLGVNDFIDARRANGLEHLASIIVSMK
jgi:hypothetical protein